ncbi:MAG: MBL fold metallo-hydrolase [Lachnospiraceae bacterium]
MNNIETKLVLLGTGTPNAEPDANGPATAVVVGDRAYLVDFGPGVVRQCSKAYRKGIKALHPKNLTVAFCTHLHTDHTGGYSDLIFTPWVLERAEVLQVYGPKGIQHMTEHIHRAYAVDIDFRMNGFEKANPTGYQVDTHEILEGIVYKDDLVSVEAISVDHGTLESYAYKFTTPDKVILISGDTCPLETIREKAKDCDILLHEVEYTKGLSQRTPQWQKYHASVHTLSKDLAEIASVAKPKLLVTYHRIYHLDVFSTEFDVEAEMAWRDEEILKEIKEYGYTGRVVNGRDLDVF